MSTHSLQVVARAQAAHQQVKELYAQVTGIERQLRRLHEKKQWDQQDQDDWWNLEEVLTWVEAKLERMRKEPAA